MANVILVGLARCFLENVLQMHLMVASRCHELLFSVFNSEATTPKSAAGECQWKRGIYHFADQLLYSLTALEKEDDGSDTISELGDKGMVFRRVDNLRIYHFFTVLVGRTSY